MTKKGPGKDRATPVVLIHGLFMTRSFWSPENYRPLAERHPVHAISLPGHYPEAPFLPGDSLTKELVLACFDRQLDHLVGQRPVALMGHSTGALMALYYASQRPQRVTRVISVGGTENGQEEAIAYRFMQYASAHWGRLGRAMIPPVLWLSSANPMLHRYFMKDALAEPRKQLADHQTRAMIESYLPDLQRLDRRTMAVVMKDLQFFDASEELRQLQVPALIICGDKDCYVSRDRTYLLGDLIPNSQVHIFADCGHMCMWEKPEMFYALVLKFLAASAPTGSRVNGREREAQVN